MSRILAIAPRPKWRITLEITINFVAVALFLLVVQRVYAAPVPGSRSTYPYNAPAATVAIPGANAQINAPESEFEIAIPGNYTGTVTITIENACKKATAAPSYGLTATIDGQTKSYPSGCSASQPNDIIFAGVTLAQNWAEYDGKLSTRTLTVRKINGQGHQPYKVHASGSNTSVSFKGDSDRSVNSFTGGKQAFAMFADPSVSFSFTPSCDYHQGDNLYLKWQDADVGNTYGQSGASFVLNEYAPDDPTLSSPHQIMHYLPSQLGGNGEQKVSSAFQAKRNYVYQWVWSGMDSINALQVFIPFSENSFNLNVLCGEPTGNLTLNCTTPKSFSVTNIADPDHGNAQRHYRLVHGGTNHIGKYTGGGSTFDIAGDVHGSESQNFSWAVGRTYFLQVQDDNGLYYNVDSARVASCGGGGGSAQPSCTAYGHTMGTNSSYRFTMFSNATAAGFTPGYDAAHANNHSLAGIVWGTFTGTQVYQSPIQAFTGSATVGYNYTYPAPTSGNGWSVYIERYEQQSDGTWDYTNGVDTINNCFAGSCTLTIDGNLPAGTNNVASGSSYGASVDVTNGGTESLTSVVWSGNANTNGNSTQAATIDSTATLELNPDPVAPTALNTYTLTATVYYGSYAVAACSQFVYVYQVFHISPNPNLNGTDIENPISVTINSVGSMDAGGPAAGVSANEHSIFYVQRNGVDLKNVDLGTYNHTYGTATDNFTQTPPGSAPTYDIQAGDKYCVTMTISPGDGAVDVNGTIANPTDTEKTTCQVVANKPYLRGFGGGFAAGSCTVPAGPDNGILASWDNNSAGDTRGAGTQLSALALLNITGVATGVGNASAGNGRMLAFARGAAGPSIHPSSPTIGGNFGSSNQCITVINAPPTTSPLPGSALASLNGAYTYGTTATPANLEFQGGNVPTGKNVSIFVTGDVYIKNGVTYSGAWNLNSANEPPSFVLHATGNIYVDPDVQELNGVYSADGKIYTCGVENSSTSYSPMDGGLLYSNCNKQLTIYGSFTAKQVNLMRTYGSIRDYAKGGVGCSNGASPTPGTPAGLALSCGGEVFRFNPLIYLAKPAINLPNNGAVHYDAITSLPPVL